MSMDFKCDQKTLADALNVAGRAVSNRGVTYGGYGGIKMELGEDKLTVTGGDGDLTIAVEIEVNPTSKMNETDPDKAVAPARLMSDLVRSLQEGAMEVKIDKTNAIISSGPTEFTIRVDSAENFPLITEDEDDSDSDASESEALTLDAERFKAAVDQVSRAASSDEGRPILTGVLLTATSEGLRLVATDSYRLAMRDVKGINVIEEDQEVLVPNRALKELSKIVGTHEEIELRLGKRNASFKVDNTTITTRLIDGTYPDYKRLIPESAGHNLTVDRQTFAATLKRIRLMATDSKPIRLTMSATEQLKVSAIAQDVGEGHESIDSEYSGEDIMIAFNPEYLIDGAETIQGEEVVMETMGELKPATMKSTEDESFIYLLMPVRVP